MFRLLSLNGVLIFTILSIVKCLIFIKFADLIFNKKKIENIYKVVSLI